VLCARSLPDVKSYRSAQVVGDRLFVACAKDLGSALVVLTTGDLALQRMCARWCVWC
jgi:hypothetical protein